MATVTPTGCGGKASGFGPTLNFSWRRGTTGGDGSAVYPPAANLGQTGDQPCSPNHAARPTFPNPSSGAAVLLFGTTKSCTSPASNAVTSPVVAKALATAAS